MILNLDDDQANVDNDDDLVDVDEDDEADDEGGGQRLVRCQDYGAGSSLR